MQYFAKLIGEISIHAPPRGATRHCNRLCAAGYFNSRPSARGDQCSHSTEICDKLFQFTPLREGRRNGNKTLREFAIISIHAPPRGATGNIVFLEGTDRISIHAPPRGATDPIGIWGKENLFQFTPLREGRRHAMPPRLGSLYFNSRPSARGDQTPSTSTTARLHFNSRPSARGDGDVEYVNYWQIIFQFTPLREGRQQKICNFCKSFVQPLQISMA